MHYEVGGRFIEACDCSVVCPCWVGNVPDNGSCTGFFAWHVETGTIDGVGVDGHSVVSVSTHLGPRSVGAGTAGSADGVTMLFVTADAGTPAYGALISAFTGGLGGPIADIVKVIDSPPEIDPQTAVVDFEADKSVRVTVASQVQLDTQIEPVTGADGHQITIHHQHLDPTLDELLVARNTSIDIRVPDPAPPPVLGGTYLFDFTKPGYSASSGPFRYVHDA